MCACVCVCSRSLTRERKCIMAACWPHLRNRQSLFPAFTVPPLGCTKAHTHQLTHLITHMLALMPTNDAGIQIAGGTLNRFKVHTKSQTHWWITGCVDVHRTNSCKQQLVQNGQLWPVVVLLWWTVKIELMYFYCHLGSLRIFFPCLLQFDILCQRENLL